MTRAEIVEYYDSNPNLTLKQLSVITGKSIDQLKLILMSEILL
jgi:hypothetical protein